VSFKSGGRTALLFIGVWFVATRAALLVGSTSWKSTLLLAPVLIYYVRMRLRLVVEHDSETKRWAAFFPELPGCASAGDTEDEAIQNAKEALELWFEPTPVDLPAGAKVLEVALT
jgi:predicted RNase H-like HicB family nuclease